MKIPVPPLGADATRDDFEVFSAPSLVRFLSRGVQPPSQIYLKHTDVLRVQCASSQTNESVTFNYRLLRADGALIKGQFIIQVPATRAVVAQSEPMAEGFLLSLSCKAAVATTRGQTFARVFLTAGSFGPNQPSYTLMADYVTTQFAPAHPNGRVLSPVEGPGWIHTAHFSGPGVGVQLNLVVPNNARWAIKTVFAPYTTDATAGNRNVIFEFFQGGSIAGKTVAITAQPPSVTYDYNLTTLFISSSAVVVENFAPIPPGLVFLPVDSIQTLVNGAGAADFWVSANVSVEEWLDNV